MWSDLRYAVRALRAAPWYAATVVAVLAVGLTLTTVAFAVVDGVLFKPLPYRRAQELFLVRADVTSVPRVEPPPVGWRDLGAWTNAVPDLDAAAVSSSLSSSFALEGRQFWSADIDERFFDVTGLRPTVGGFLPEDFDQRRIPGKPFWEPVLISDRLWQTMMSADPAPVGRTLVRSELDGVTYGWRIAGVLPADFVFPLAVGVPQPDVITPLTRAMRAGRTRELQVIVRLPASSEPLSVAGRLTAATRRLTNPPLEGHQPGDALQRLPFDEVRLLPIGDHLAHLQRPAFRLVFAGAALLLLLASVNVAGLAAARHANRRRELMVRRALGAGEFALGRIVFSEIGLLVAAGAGVALLAARPLLIWTLDLLPPSVALLKVPALDTRVLGAASVLALASAILVTMLPLRLGARLSSNLNGLGTTSTRPLRRRTFAVVSLQVGLGFVLLIGGALTVISLANAWRTDSGYRRDRMVLLEVFVNRYADGADALSQLEDFERALGQIPGVERAAFSTIQPLFTRWMNAWTAYLPDGWSGPTDRIQSRPVSDGFFEVMGLPIVEGRLPAAGEWTPDQPVAIVSRTAARLLWPGQNPVGRPLAARPNLRGPARRFVIGVVADARFSSLDEDPKGEIYLPDRIVQGRTGAFFHVRADEPDVVLQRILQVASARRLYVTQATTHEDALFASVRHRALAAWLFGSLGLASLVIVGTGILGLLAISASQRAREIGIRCVLGATPARVVLLLVREQAGGLATGLSGGAIVTAWVVQYVQSQLYGVRPYDLGVWAGSAATLVAVAIAGTLVPSIRAARADPVRVLHVE